jgi:hypothetical protein
LYGLSLIAVEVLSLFVSKSFVLSRELVVVLSLYLLWGTKKNSAHFSIYGDFSVISLGYKKW